MKLSKFDNRCIRLMDSSGNIFEGICSYQNPAYNEHEYDRKEEGLQMANFLFFKSDIKEIESLEDQQGTFGRFSSPYGLLEEMNVEDGIDSICEVLFSEENEHIYRMLLCLEAKLTANEVETLDRGKLKDVLEELHKFDIDEACKEKAEDLLEHLG